MLTLRVIMVDRRQGLGDDYLLNTQDQNNSYWDVWAGRGDRLSDFIFISVTNRHAKCIYSILTDISISLNKTAYLIWSNVIARLLDIIRFLIFAPLHTSTIKVESHITKQLLTSISVDIRINVPLKVIYTSALRPRWILLVDTFVNPHVYLNAVINCIISHTALNHTLTY